MEQKPRITKIVPPQYDSNASEQNNLDDEHRKAARDAARKIIDTFEWDQTLEGEAFWRSVYDRLCAIANGEPLK